MAEIRSYLDDEPAIPEDNTLGTAGDFAKTLGAGTARVGSNLAGAARYVHEGLGNDNVAALSKSIQSLFSAADEGITGTINPATRKLAESAITSETFWEHPVLATALKATGMLPTLAAAAIPGGLMTDALGATVVAAGAGGVLNAADGVDEFYKKLDAMSDDELQKQSYKYRVLRETMDEEPARKRFNREAQGWGPLVNLLIGAAGGVIGPEAIAARKLATGAGNVIGAAEKGVLKRAGVAAGEGVASEAVEEGVQDVTQQSAEIDAGMQKEFDRARAANAALEGGYMGGLFGGVVGAVAGGHKAAKPPPLPVRPTDTEVTTDVAPPQVKEGSTGTPAKPAEIVANPQNAPTATSRDMGKDDTRTAASKNPPPIPSDQLDPAVVAAVTANEGTPVKAAPTEVAAMEQRSPNETLDKLDEEAPVGAAGATAKTVEDVPAAAPVTPEGNAPQLDTGQNVPEKPESIVAQLQQLVAGQRAAVMFPKGTPIPKKNPPGMKRTRVNDRGTFIYDPKRTSPAKIQELSKAGRENELLALGPVSKPEAVADAAAGATPVAVTERTPAGTEVKAAAGTTATLPEQRAALEATKTPGNVVSVEAPEDVIAYRTKPGGGRVLPNLAVTAETTPLSDFTGKVAETSAKQENEGPAKTNYRGKRGQERDQKLDAAKKAVENNLPNPDAEEGYHRLPARRDVVVARLRKMVAEYEKATGKEVQTQIKKSKDGNAASDDPNVLILRLAKDVVRSADKNPQGKAITDLVSQYKGREALIRAGAADEVVAERLAEGEQRSRRSTQEQVDNAADDSVAYDARNDEFSNDEQVDPEVVEEAPIAETAADNIAEPVGEIEEASGEIKQGPSVKHVEVKLEKAKSTLSPREARKAALAAVAAKKGAPDRAPAKNAPRAREAVDRNPSDAQIAAGNYKKGHRRVEGLDFTIENPKGAVRRGVDEDGRAWEVRMPADYGYIRRTRGADGDHIDAYDLRTGDRTFVIDQLDAKTGEFDEHKVAFRAKDEQHVVDTYTKAFSDGKAPERLGNLHEVTRPELHEWLNEGDTKRPITAHVLDPIDDPYTEADLDIEDVFRTLRRISRKKSGQQAPLRTVNVWDGKKAVPVQVLQTETFGDAIAKYDMGELPGMAGYLGKFFKKKFTELAENVQVHYVDGANMALAAHGEYSTAGSKAAGLHFFEAGGENSPSHILINIDHMDTSHVGHMSTAQVLLHEAAHQVTVRELTRNKQLRDVVGSIAYHVDAYMKNSANKGRIDSLRAQGYDLNYAFTDPYEFIAESFSNDGFQKLLAVIPVDRATAKAAGLRGDGKFSVWDAVRNVVRGIIFGRDYKGPKFHTALDAIMKVGEQLTLEHERTFAKPYKTGQIVPERTHDFANRQSARMVDDATTAVRNWLSAPENNLAGSAPKALKLRTFDNIARIADHYFGENNPVRKIHSAIERMRVRAEQIEQESEPILRKLAELRTKNRAAFEELSSLMHDATVANVHPDVALTDAKNAHLGKDALRSVWAKAQHKALMERFNALPEEYKQAFHETTKHFRDQQNKMSLGIIQNQVLKLLGHDDAALARRVHEGTLTDADRKLLGSNVDVLEDAGELSKIEGPYVPLMRRGDHVVKGDYKVTSPGNAKVISNSGGDVEFEFATRKEAEDYAKGSKLQADIKKVWVDEKSGEMYVTDAATGEKHKVLADDLDSVDRYRVKVRNRHVEFIEGKRAANARAAELAADGSIDVHQVVPRSREPDGRQGAELSTALQRLVKRLERSDAYKASTPTEKAALRRAIEEAALASHGSTRVSSRALPRRGVKGYSEDLVQNTADYAGSSSRYLARLEYGTQLETGLKEMEAQLGRDHSKTGQYARTAISNEVRDRVEGDNGYQQGGVLAPVVKRLLSASFTDKLGSPAYSVINATQPAMITMPYLAARYGVGRAFAALGRAYSDINAGSILKEGAAGTVRAARGKEAKKDLMSLVKHTLSDDERAMIDHQIAEGTISADAGMEVQHIAKSYEGLGGKADRVLGYLEGVTREMPRAVEMINRAATALSTYRLERAKGATHEKATQAATDAVNATQFNYSPTNAPALFNHPLLKIALQFKKYGQGIYQLIGSQIGDAIRNESPGDRARALKTLAGVAATHVAMAGALGLPTEPFKYLVLAAQGVGLTNKSWSDVENEIRRQAAGVFGKAGGEVVTRGLPRLFNLDLGRMGLDSVTSFGEPRGTKESDVKSWIFDSVSGPVVSLGADYIKGAQSLANGDVVKAAERLVPLKAASDAIRAYRQVTEGKKTAGGKQSSAPYSPTEAAMRVLGFGNAREAEEGAQRAAFYRASTVQKEERSALVNSWVEAKPQDKAKAWSSIQKFNQSAPAEVKITAKELTDKAKRDAKAAQTAKLGITPNKRDKRFLDEGIYNLR